MRRSLAFVALLSGIAPTALYAQTVPAPASAPSKPHRAAPPQSEDDSDDDIVVTSSRKLPGSVVGDIPPEQTLGPADVRSFGVSSIGDLLTELAPETRSDRGSGGAPVVLLSGRRISSFAEIRDLPTEAIARVEILPEEVALKYGYRADQRVVNIVLRNRFKAITGELGDRLATEGGRNSPSGAVDVLTINRTGRFSLHTAYSESSALFENERNVIEQPSNFDPVGTILPGANSADGQIDPALSALVGQAVTSAGVPVSAANGAPGLADFTATANRLNGYDQGKYRTLLPKTRTYTTNAVLNRTLFGNVSATLNGSVTYNESDSEQGLADISLILPAGNPYSPFSRDVVLDRAASGLNPLEQNNSSLAWSLNGSMNGDMGHWRWTLSANYDRSTSETFTERGLDVDAANALLKADDPNFNPFGPIDPANYAVLAARHVQSTSNAGVVTAMAQGSLFKLPAGDVTTSITANGSLSSLDTTSSPTITRNTINGLANADLPITSKSKGVLGAIGDLSLNGNIEVDSVSGFRTLVTTGYGGNWSPITGLRFLVSVTDAQDAPSATQLGGPVIVTPNVRVFDYVTGQTVNVSTTTGGNPFLDASDKHTVKFGMTLKPFEKQDLTITASYISTHTRNSLAVFPSATAAVEAAFCDRFTRDGTTSCSDPTGNLTAIDMRPVNFDRIESSELRWGINFSTRLKSKLQKEIEAYRAGTGPNPFVGLHLPGGRRVGGGGPGGAGGNGQPGAAPGAGGQDSVASGTQPNGASGQAGGRPGGGFGGGGGRGGRGGGFGGRGGGAANAGGRLQMALYHTWIFTDRVDIAPGVPVIDLLNGGAIGSGGQSRHELEGQLGYNNNGLGVRFSADWKSGTHVLGGTVDTPNTLDFSSLGTINMRLFADLGQQLDFLKKHPWAMGMRVTVGFTNLLDTRQKVRDATGATPISYQPDILDPLGRTVQVGIRKMFF